MNPMFHNTKQLSSAMFHTANLQTSSKYETISAMPKKEKIPNNIYKLRRNLGLTQEEFGRPLHKSRADISRYEKGDHLNLHIIFKIKKVYGFTFDQMLEVGEMDNMHIPVENMSDSEKIAFLLQTVKKLAIEKTNTRKKLHTKSREDV